MPSLPSPPRPADDLRGICFAVFAYLLFTCSDAVIKVLAPYYSQSQLVFLNMSGALLMAVPLVLLTGGRRQLRMFRPALHIGRGLIILTMTYCATYAFAHLPMSMTYVIIFLAPLFTVTLANLWLGEPVRPMLWGCVLVGFAGVLICVEPGGATWHPAILAAVVIAMGSAAANLLTRQYGRAESPQSLMFSGAVTMVLGSCWVVFSEQWQPLQWDLLWWHLLFGGLGAGASLTITIAYQKAPASLLGSFQYTQLLWGGLLGFFFWQEIPAPSLWLGSALIVGSGLVILRLRSSRSSDREHNPPLLSQESS